MKKVILLMIFVFTATGCAALQESLNEASRSSKREMPYDTYNRIATWEAAIRLCYNAGFLDGGLVSGSMNAINKAKSTWSYDESLLNSMISEGMSSTRVSANRQSCAEVQDLARRLVVDYRSSSLRR